MAPHSSTFAWNIPWMEKPGRLQSMGSRRVGQDRTTSLSFFTFIHWRRNPLQCSYLENPRDGGAWWAAIYGVTQSRTQLKQLSSSSSKHTHTHIVHIHVCMYWEKAIATHFSTLAWKILWMEKPGRFQSMGSQRVGHD